ncbi:MAG: DUF3027 domain-containing protein [Actinomycetes bacterium]
MSSTSTRSRTAATEGSTAQDEGSTAQDGPSSSRATRSRSRPPARDAQCLAAVDLARDAVVEVAGPDNVGDAVDVQTEGERLVTHLFAATTPGYRGWHWAVTVTRAPRARVVTVNEVVLLPGPDALVAPEWVPWSERIRPGDLGVGDLLPTQRDDPRLAPGYTGEDLEPDTVGEASRTYEMGLGRARVLSREGRDEAAFRWNAGDSGPDSPVARSAPAHCATCGFFVPLEGALGRVFGACANEMSPSDGTVVSADHGCGAHSEGVEVPGTLSSGPPILDESGYDELAVHASSHSEGSVDAAAVEDLGHS